MSPEVGPDERTDRHDGEAAPPDVVQSSGYELGRDAMTFKRRSDLGVDERHPPATEAIEDEPDYLGAQAGLVAPLLRVVRDDELGGGGHQSTLATGRSAIIVGNGMDDAQIHSSIEQLVAEEHELWEREAAGTATDDDRRRLESLKLSLDQFWDLLRQRRALRESGGDPEAAHVRPPDVVEGYEQ